MNWAGHWHGYGPWTGTRDAYGQESLRRPGGRPDSEQTRSFVASTLPPMKTGHWLMRTDQTAAERTWTDALDAVTWLKTVHTTHQPFEREDRLRAYPDLHTKVAYAYDALPRGTDVVWVHYTKAQSLVSLSVVCCPSHFHPGIPCPLPPH
ncbi:hypothetical protein [Streptomyces jumonjinensis]|uniref:hypothetical protein n=1 Tax=Streptomyces jumonjinensis TaxID=1945 RepID=UPI00378D2244